MACVALYAEDDSWYRGEVLNCDGSGIDILFVDYGNSQLTPVGDVRLIDDEFVTLAPQAYHCCLAGVERADATSFKTAVMSRLLKATFTGKLDGKYEVRLVDQVDSGSVVVNDMFERSLSPVGRSLSPVEQYSSLAVSSTLLDVSVSWFYHLEKFFLTPTDTTAYDVSNIT